MCAATTTEIERALRQLKRATPTLVNEVRAWHEQYQEHLDAWVPYVACMSFRSDSRCPLPYTRHFFNMDADMRSDLVTRMAALLREAKHAGSDIADADVREAVFCDALQEVFMQRFCGTDRSRRRLWDAHALVDEAIYHGALPSDALDHLHANDAAIHQA